MLEGRDVTRRLDSAREETMALDPIGEDCFPAEDTWLVNGTREAAFEEARAFDTDTRSLERAGGEGGTDMTRGLEACAMEIREPEETILVASVVGGRLLEWITLTEILVLNPCDERREALGIAVEYAWVAEDTCARDEIADAKEEALKLCEEEDVWATADERILDALEDILL